MNMDNDDEDIEDHLDYHKLNIFSVLMEEERESKEGEGDHSWKTIRNIGRR